MKRSVILIPLIFFFKFSFATNYFWVNGSGNWNDFANHWATTSGGTSFQIQPPQPTDDVYFDANSFTAPGQVVSQNNAVVFCNSFSWQNTLTGSKLISTLTNSKITVFGSIDVGPNTKIGYKGIFSFASVTNTNIINFQDSMVCTMEFNSPQGEWSLSAPLISKANQTEGGKISLQAGTLNTNNFLISCNYFISKNGNNSRVFNPGTSVIKILGAFYDDLTGTFAGGWEIDSNLVFNGSAAELNFQAPAESPDTSFVLGSLFECRFNMETGNQYYQTITYTAATDTFGMFSLQHIVWITGQNMEAGEINFTNAGFYFDGQNFTADSVICRSDHNLETQVSIVTNRDQHVNYIEAPSVRIEVGRNSYFPTIISRGDTWFDATCNNQVNSNHFLPHIQALRNFTVSIVCGNLTIGKCIIGKNGTINSSCSFDTLMFSKDGTYLINVGDTVTVNDNFIAIGNSIQPIQIYSQNTGSQAFMKFNQNAVCTDYLYLRDMVALGTNVSAGTNSINISNNIGWQFTPCSVVTDVWPGDANYDLVVNNFDVLAIGLAYNDTGAIRANASLNYTGQPAANWNEFFITAVNKKHADCDGNGIADASDTAAIILNYGLVHPAKPSDKEVVKNSGAPIYFLMPGSPLNPGSVVSIPIMLGNGTFPVNSIYGIAFSIGYDTSIISSQSIAVDYAGSWIASPGDFISIEKYFTSEGQIDIAFSRIDKTNKGGQGLIATLHFTILPNSNDTLHLKFSNLLGIMQDGTQVPLSAIDGSVIAGLIELTSSDASLFYPNPMHDFSQLVFSNPEQENFKLIISDQEGRLVYTSQPTTSGILTVEKKDLKSGIYFYALINEKRTKTSKGKFVIY